MGKRKGVFEVGRRYALKKCLKEGLIDLTQPVSFKKQPGPCVPSRSPAADVDFSHALEQSAAVQSESLSQLTIPTSKFTIGAAGSTISKREFHRLLGLWSLEVAVSCNGLNSLLKLLRLYGIDVPKDYRTLRKTPQCLKLHDVAPGRMFRRPLEPLLLSVLENYKGTLPSVIPMHHNSDGLPVFVSSRMTFWPIQVYLDLPGTRPVFVQIWGGEGKPKNFDVFYEDFVKEALAVFAKLLCIRGKYVRITDGDFSADAPCIAEALAIKGHSGYCSCWKCEVIGEYYKHRVVFPGTSFAPRTEEKFRNRQYDGIHTSTSITELEKFHTNVLSAVKIDSMHCVYLGVQKALLTAWTTKTGALKWSSKRLAEASIDVVELSKNMTSEFPRSFRAFDELAHMKATEYRNFLLYIGPVILKKYLSPEHYSHFLHLHVGIRILSHPTHAKDRRKNNIANAALTKFVADLGDLYGNEYYSSNVHKLLHIANDALDRGSIDEYSCFRYESNLYQLKKMVEANQFSLEQVGKRIIEYDGLSILSENRQPELKYPILKKKKEFPIEKCLQLSLCSENDYKNCIFFEQILIGPNSKLTAGNKDSYFFSSDKRLMEFLVAIVNNENLLICSQEIHATGNLYDFPIESRHLGIFKRNSMSQGSSLVVKNSYDFIVSKAMKLPFAGDEFFQILLHTGTVILILLI